MILNTPKLHLSRKKAVVSATITAQNGKTHEVWVSVDKKFAPFLTPDIIPFASAMLLPCSKRGEDITLTAPVSKRWATGAHQIVKRVVNWKTGFKPIAIIAKKEVDTTAGKGVGVFFSGGVDSFSAYLKYKQSNDLKISHFIFVHGFDIDLENQALYEKAARKIRAAAKQEGITLIEVKTNVRLILDTLLRWDMSHGGALALVALLLRKGFKTVIIPGGGNVEPQEPWGSCAYIDPRWSTETLSIVHDLDYRTRLEKVEDFIASSKVALRYLRVCWRNIDYNCGECDKCLETMIDLRVNGVLDRCASFPKKLDLDKVSRIYSTPYTNQQYFVQDIELLEKTGQDPDLLAALKQCLHASLHPSLKRTVVNYVHHLDFTYNESRVFVFMTRVSRNPWLNNTKIVIYTITNRLSRSYASWIRALNESIVKPLGVKSGKYIFNR